MATDAAQRRRSAGTARRQPPGTERADRDPPTAERGDAPAAQRDDTPTAGHAGEQERPLASYALLTSAFAGLAGSFSLWMRRTGRTLPERVEPGDLALGVLATHKLARLVSKDKVTSAVRAPFTRYEGEGGPAEVRESARGHGLRRAIGELLSCPYCLGLWIAAAYTAGMAVAPRPTRWVASVFTIQLGSDVLQVGYKKLEDTL
jgi:uncharacterized protein DUF1360